MTENWADFDKRTQVLPSAERTKPFLDHLASHALVLDFGCGTGRWTAAFLRDRPDLTVDIVDQRFDGLILNPHQMKGEKYQTDFRDFHAVKNYAGIWAYHSLFFLAGNEVNGVFHELAGSLIPRGVFAFTMVLDSEAARQCRLTGMSETAIDKMLETEGLAPLSVCFDETTEYRYKMQRQKISTFYVYAQKPAVG